MGTGENQELLVNGHKRLIMQDEDGTPVEQGDQNQQYYAECSVFAK